MIRSKPKGIPSAESSNVSLKECLLDLAAMFNTIASWMAESLRLSCRLMLSKGWKSASVLKRADCLDLKSMMKFCTILSLDTTVPAIGLAALRAG
ncbi:hypothetical protein D3C77_580500 [compost metagenome]